MSENLTIKFWDVQHGNATHIRTPNGRHVVIDLGDADSLTGSAGRFSPLRYLRHNQSVATIDHLVLTHPHRDHIDDISNLETFFIPVLSRPRWLGEADIRQGNRPEDGSKVSEYIQLEKRFDQQVARPNDITVPADWGGAIFAFYSSPDVPKSNLNNHSLVTFVSFAGCKALLPGDNESTSWQALLKNSAFVSELPAVDVLLAPHHGREAGFCEELFAAGLSPKVTIISDDQAGTTSVTSKYYARTTGWGIELPDGTFEDRHCVTTRSDGNILVTFGVSSKGNFLNVKVNQ